MLIKIILVSAFTLMLLLYLRTLKNRLATRITFILVFGTAIVFVMLPDITSHLAKAVGVGRGTDLILYLSVVLNFMLFLILYGKLRRVEQIQTEIIRKDAIRNSNLKSE